MLTFATLTHELLDLRAEVRRPAAAAFAMVVDCCCSCCSLGCCRD